MQTVFPGKSASSGSFWWPDPFQAAPGFDAPVRHVFLAL